MAYPQLDALFNAAASGLTRRSCALGLARDDCIAILAANSDEFLAAAFRCVRRHACRLRLYADQLQVPAGIFLYTSGSTGRPKDVVLSHAGHIWATGKRIEGQDYSTQQLLVAAPLYHMNGLAIAQLAMRADATLVVLPQFNAREYISAIETWRCTWLTAVPPMLAMMLQKQEAMKRADLSSVQFIRMGSAALSASLLARIHAALPGQGGQ